MERKRLFVVILLVFAGSNAMAAMAPNIWVLSLARFILTLALPVFWGTASDTASQLAGPERSSRAISLVYLCISAAMLFGIPLGTLAAEAIGWRGAFWLLAAMSLLTALLLYLGMPALHWPKRMVAPPPRQRPNAPDHGRRFQGGDSGRGTSVQDCKQGYGVWQGIHTPSCSFDA